MKTVWHLLLTGERGRGYKMRTKRCSKCKEDKPFSHFHKDAASNDGVKTQCKVCKSTIAKVRRTSPEILARERALQIKRLYNIEVEEYDEFMSKPCAICADKSTHLDHCHTTGKVVGGLCQKCNHAIGLMKEDVGLLIKAAQYVFNFKKSKKV